MSLFVLIGKTGPDAAARRSAVRPRHLEHLQALERAGRIRLAGPLLEPEEGNPCGSLVVFEAESAEAARAVAEQDPYVTEGVLATWEVLSFTQVIPGPPA